MPSLVSIVMYHYVRPVKGSRYPSIKGLEVSDFESQLDFLERNYSVWPLNRFLDAWQANESLPERIAILTFDDGYSDHYQYVLPRLQQRGLCGTFFPVTEAVRSRRMLDVNKIHFLLASADPREITASLKQALIEMKAIDGEKGWSEICSKYLKGDRFDSPEVLFLKRLLQKGLEGRVRSAVLTRLFAEFVTADEEDIADDLYLSESHLKEMIAAGMEIGCHSATHPWLSTLDYNAQRREIEDSVSYLNSLGPETASMSFCYPYGDFDTQTIEILTRAGVRSGVTTVANHVDTGTANRLLLPRLDTNDFPPKSRNALGGSASFGLLE